MLTYKVKIILTCTRTRTHTHTYGCRGRRVFLEEEECSLRKKQAIPPPSLAIRDPTPFTPPPLCSLSPVPPLPLEFFFLDIKNPLRRALGSMYPPPHMVTVAFST
jgi:hypothetical protein